MYEFVHAYLLHVAPIDYNLATLAFYIWYFHTTEDKLNPLVYSQSPCQKKNQDRIQYYR